MIMSEKIFELWSRQDLCLGLYIFSVELSIKFIMLINTTNKSYKARTIIIFTIF